MVSIIKDKAGNLVKEPEEKYIVQMIDGTMIGGETFREATAAIVGREYIDCETAETEWLMRLDAAKAIGLFINENEEKDNVIVYDERIGKIPYSYTDTNPEYKLPANPELIRVESEETFILTLAKIRYIGFWEKKDAGYENLLKICDVDSEIISCLREFKGKELSIPLHEKLNKNK